MGNLPTNSKIVQSIIIIALCIVFLQFFGLSTLEKWKRRDVQAVRRKEGGRSLPPPALTICAIAKDFLGWKPQAPEGAGLDKCRGEGDMVEECVKKYTFALEDVLNSSSKWTFSKETNVLEATSFI